MNDSSSAAAKMPTATPFLLHFQSLFLVVITLKYLHADDTARSVAGRNARRAEAANMVRGRVVVGAASSSVEKQAKRSAFFLLIKPIYSWLYIYIKRQ